MDVQKLIDIITAFLANLRQEAVSNDKEFNEALSKIKQSLNSQPLPQPNSQTVLDFQDLVEKLRGNVIDPKELDEYIEKHKLDSDG